MPIPPDPVLKAALRWLEHLQTSDVVRTRKLFTSHRAFGDITPTQYAAAYTWLHENGLLGTSRSSAECKIAIFEVAVTQTLWFADANVLVQESGALPEDGHRLAAALEVSTEEAFASVRHAWAKMDVAERARVGTAGELAVVELLSAMPGLDIKHVAAESDGYGYDIRATGSCTSLHLEVKATTRRGYLRIYLSRNEYETMRRDAAWTLVVVRLDRELRPVALATINRNWVSGSAPVDCQPGVRWESARLDVPHGALTSGIPALVRAAERPPLPIFQGEPPWPG